ncbi:EKC/KEOPS complex subunit LAGE3-like [Cynocephalus volans]|uniref:EKC/KEOPS complex subunit LAGE3-like n=1 Tax=Cynocephalus volans TaxID=110931 RepID=UPI002FCA0B86
MERAPGPGGDAAPVAGGPDNRQVQLYPIEEPLWPGVPFPSPENVEIASLFLTPNAQRRLPVQKEISVNGNVLTVRLTAEDPSHLHVSVIACLYQLSVLVRLFWPVGPPLFFKPHEERGI